MATAADKKRWDKLHADYAKAREELQAYESELGAKYGYQKGWQTWLNKTQRGKLERLGARADKIGDKIVDLLVRISPRSEAWLTGVPAWWIREQLTWEDVIRPAGEPLSVVVPGAYGYPDGYVKEQPAEVDRKELKPGAWIEVRDPDNHVSYGLGGAGIFQVIKVGRVNVKASSKVRFRPDGPWYRHEHTIPLRHVVRVVPPSELHRTTESNMENNSMEIVIPKMPMWEQIGGDMSPGAHGGLLARSDGDALELLQIQPVRAYIGDREAAEVGFPFWTREGWYDLEDLNPEREDVQHALQSRGLELDALAADFTPTQRALAIAEALLDYGSGVDEGPAGWSEDVVPDEVKWMTGVIEGADYLSTEDQEFRDEILGHGEIKEKLEEAVQQMVDESAAQGWSQVDDQTMIDLDAQGFEGKSAFAIADFGDAIAVNTEVTLAPDWAKELGIKSEDRVLIWGEIGTRELESWLEKNGYDVTDRGGAVPDTEGYAYAEHVIQRVARNYSKETVEEVAQTFDWWQEEIPGSTDGYVTIWAKKAE